MKIPRPEHSSWFLCPPQPLLLFPGPLEPPPGFIDLDLLYLEFSLFTPCFPPSLKDKRAEFILCIYFSPSPHPTHSLCMPCITSLSWPELNASELSSSSSWAGFYHTPSPPPSSLTAAKSAAAPPGFILLLLFITLWGFGLSCCTTSTVVWKNATAQQMWAGIPPKV